MEFEDNVIMVKNLKGEEKPMKVFHGGCLGCISQVEYGIGSCSGCKYANGVTSGYPDLGIRPKAIFKKTEDERPL